MMVETGLQTATIMGFKVIDEDISNLFDLSLVIPKKYIINTISPNSYGISTYDDSFKLALESSILVLDGVYFSLPTVLKRRGWVVSNQGPQITKKALEFANTNGLKVFFMGSTESTLDKIKQRLNNEYPEIRVETYSPPYKLEFDSNDNNLIHERINQFNPHFLFIGMTCPKQEKWIYQNKEFIKFNVSLSVGGVFDWFAGNINEIPQIWWDMKLGWLYRICQRPQIIRRNFRNTVIFFRDVIRELYKNEN